MTEEQIRRHVALDAIKAALHKAINSGFLPVDLDVDSVVIHPADAQALADVRTLDEWQAGRPERYWACGLQFDQACCKLHDGFRALIATEFFAPTPEAARAKAAAWAREQKP
jgi:hypothetical protein